MADRRSAGTFADLFIYIAAEGADLSLEGLARLLWKMARRHDFHPRQMDIPDILASLGLSEKRDIGGDKHEWLYGPEGDRE